jgi:hypothetical protein
VCNEANSFETPQHNCAEAHHVLALLALREDEVFASGSAVLVAPHLALTARHVLDDFSVRYQGYAEEADGRTSYSIVGRGFYAGQWRMFHVRQTFNCAGTDISALYVSPYDEPADFRWPAVTLDLLPPRRLSRVWSWGHISPQALLAGTTGDEIHWYASLARSSGRVQEIYPRLRDATVVNYPAFQFDGRVDASMSGGPVFDEHGHLVGINTRSMPATSGCPIHTSTAALLWPVPALPFANMGETFPEGTSIQFVEDVHRLGFLTILNHDAVHVDRLTSPGELHVSVAIPTGHD